jgi:hypothetical protein
MRCQKIQRHYIGIERTAYVEIARQRIDSIPEPLFVDDSLLETRSKRSAPRVSFGNLIESQYLRIGQKLYSKNRKTEAVIKADAQLQVDGFAGSIHKVAARMLGKDRANGWDFWYFADGDGDLADRRCANATG